MAFGTELLAAGAAGGLSWLNDRLSAWLADRKSSAEEAKAWQDVSRQVLRQTKAMCERHSKITTVAFPHIAVAIRDIYVPLTLENASCDLKSIVDSFPKNIFETYDKVLIVDVAGMGKSTISRLLFTKSLDDRAFLPVLVDLRRLDGKQSIGSALGLQFGIRQKHAELFDEFLRTQPLLFILDGFDEVADPFKTMVSRTIRDFVDSSGNGKFVITSRPELPFSDYADFERFKIKELTPVEAASLITKYGVAFGIEESAKALLDELKARHSEPVSSFLKNPLLASLLFRSFEFKSVVPVKRGVFYRQVFDALFEAHDLNKETGYVRTKKTGLHHDDFHRALRAVAFLFKKQKSVEVTADVFKAMAKEVSKTLCPDLLFSPDDFLHDAVHAVPVFTRDGNFVRWSHKSLLDYFLADFLLRDHAGSKSEALARNAFGLNARANENFLVLVNEADPILFAESVTIPAIDALLERYQSISEAIPDVLEPEIREDLATFFMTHEVILGPDVGVQIDPWAAFLVECVNPEKLDLGKFTLVLIRHFGQTRGEAGLMLHEAASALHVPMSVTNSTFFERHQMSRTYPRTWGPGDAVAPKKMTAFYASRLKARKWDNLEHDFVKLVMGAFRPDEMSLFRPSQLERKRNELQLLVDASIEARSFEF